QSAQPGQFVIIRVDEKGERIPMGLAGWNKVEGTIDIVFYILGTSTSKLSALKQGESVINIAGPLGTPTDIQKFGTVICACGCFGIGPTLPLIKALKDKGNKVITVVEGRGPDFVFWVDKLKEVSDEVHVLTGSGRLGWANDFIENVLASGMKVDRIFVHGCPFMMKVSAEASKQADVKTIVSLTPIMVDGTGMCGACRVEVGGKTKFACVDGPDFDGHQVNWDGLVLRLRQFIPEENKSFNIWERENWHRLTKRPLKLSSAEMVEARVEDDHLGACKA
ncbi:MAG: sulfide/dihydroorotate dehydrogenase-like FAD/NAD-binding protein, partial [Methanotrichaceae archaeon]|nr:sulfide/dihydroorotate dehydrogenase-like FAD/NAD-binding protein [Methanotrichaceae archaeon]